MDFSSKYADRADPEISEQFFEVFEKVRPYAHAGTEDFVDGLKENFKERGSLTVKQNDKLEEIVDGLSEELIKDARYDYRWD